MQNAVFAALMGLIQGLTEFLPVSSSGHLVIFDNIFAEFSKGPLNGDLFFKVLLHAGTLISVCVYYRRDIAGMAVDAFSIIPEFAKTRRINETANRRTLLMILISLLPLFLVFPFKSKIEALFTSLSAVGVLLLLTAVLLFLSDKFGKSKYSLGDMPRRNALVIGIFQTIAILPGLSRSGSTISAGVFCGLKRVDAVRFSFLMSLPTILAALFLELLDALEAGIDAKLVPSYIIGAAVAAVTGYFAIRLVKFVAEKGKFGIFACYCALAGAAVIIYSFVK